jgi:hypothetical protein
MDGTRDQVKQNKSISEWQISQASSHMKNIDIFLKDMKVESVPHL